MLLSVLKTEFEDKQTSFCPIVPLKSHMELYKPEGRLVLSCSEYPITKERVSALRMTSVQFHRLTKRRTVHVLMNHMDAHPTNKILFTWLSKQICKATIQPY